MVQVTTAEAQQRLPELLAEAQAGQQVEIHADNGQIFHLVANGPHPRAIGVPKAGSCKGMIEIAPDFDEPLDERREYME